MATLAEIENAIRNADAAGRRDDVRALAAERDKMLVRGGDEPSRASRVAAGASRILGNMDDQTTPEGRSNAAYEAMPTWKKAIVTAYDTGNMMAEGATAHLLDKAVAATRAPFTDKTYAEELAGQRQGVQQSQAHLGPLASGTAEIAGMMLSPSKIGEGANLLTRGAIAGTEGATYGGARALADDQNVAEGAGWGALSGLGGQAIGEGVNLAAKGFDKGRQVLSDPTFRNELWREAKTSAIGAGAGYALDYLTGFGDPVTGFLLAHGRKALPSGGSRIPTLPPTQPSPGAPGLRDTLSQLASRIGIYGTGQ